MFIAVTHCSLQQRVKRVRVEQGWPTFLKLRATSWVPINVNGHQFNTCIINKINIHQCEDTDNVNAIL